MTYTLKNPKTVGEDQITELSPKELELDDIIKVSEVDQTNLKAMRDVLAEVTGVDKAVLGRLSIVDWKGLIDHVLNPLDQAPGKTPVA